MSEYQYYEFHCIDRPLSRAEREALRKISSRARITATLFQNEYEYGDLKADPLKLLARYFDAFFYLANWGTRQLALRLPADAVDLPTWERYLDGEQARLVKVRDRVLLDITAEIEDDEGLDPQGILGSLDPLRQELLAGDLRPLYLAWLKFVAEGTDEDDLREPPVPRGLGMLTPAQEAFVEYFDVNRDLLAAAQQGSPVHEARESDPSDWLRALEPEQKDRLLLSALDGAAEVQRAFRDWQRGRAEAAAESSRTVGDLWAEAGEIAEERSRRREEEERIRRQEQEELDRRLREWHLKTVAAREAEAWREVGQGIETRQPRGYDRAVEVLCDLRDVLHSQGRSREFEDRVAEIRMSHRLKGNLLARMDGRGLVGSVLPGTKG